MIRFECDYNSGATNEVLNALVSTNFEQSIGYSEDEHTRHAQSLIMEKLQHPQSQVHFVVGGTQANLLVIASALRPIEGVISADTGHINVHETGAIEATGHKVLALPATDGKITAEQVRDYCVAHNEDSTHEHMVKPGMVYISHPTEMGTLYSLSELKALSETCKEQNIYLFVDGARLGYGLAADPCVGYAQLAELTDAFTIGGTKVGLLFGEAVVLNNQDLQRDFRYHIKQRGALFAKGRLLGVQFETLMQGDYYIAQAKRANEYAQEIKQALINKGVPFLSDTICNQIFPIFEDGFIDKISEHFAISYWQRVDSNRSAIRFCTSVLTPRPDVDALLNWININL